jgi:dihydroflavonol-4-reductase
LPETVLVTGATGFLGSALCRSLLASGHPVRALHRPTSSLAALDGLPVTRFVGDILEPDSLRPALDGAEWVFHAAAAVAHWRKPEHLVRTAVEGTRNVLEAARRAGVKRAVLTSSIAALGAPKPGTLLDEAHEFNFTPKEFLYGYAKRQAEIEAHWVTARGLPVVIVNPSAILGPGDLNQIGGSVVIEAVRGRTWLYTDGGTNWVHVADVVAGHLAAMQQGRPGERYILAGENLTHRQALQTLAELTGGPAPRVRIPGPLIGPCAAFLDLFGRPLGLPINGTTLRLARNYFFCDASKARRDLGLAEPLTFRQAAQEAYDWYKQSGVLKG